MSPETKAVPLPKISPDLFAGVIAGFLFAATGPVAIMFAVGLNNDIPFDQLTSWVFGAFFINGLLSIGMSIFYRQPLIMLWSIPGVVLVGQALTQLSFQEVVGAYLGTGILLFLLGITGTAKRLSEIIPQPIVMAMVSGIFLQFGLDWVSALTTSPAIALSMTAAFLVTSGIALFKRWRLNLISAIVVGVLVLMLGTEASFDLPFDGYVAVPHLFSPEFSWRAQFELVVPLAVAVIAVQNGQGFALLRMEDYDPPVGAITVMCGIGSMITAFVGSVSTCLTGGVSGIIVSQISRDRQFVAAIAIAVPLTLFGLFSPLMVSWLVAVPTAFIATLAGMALLPVLQASFLSAFNGRYSLGALVAFLVTLSDITLLNIGASFWGLVFGFCISFALERESA